MRPPVIRKTAADLKVAPNLGAAGMADVSWDAIRQTLGCTADGPAGGINIAYSAVDRHARGARAGEAALRWLPIEGDARTYTYNDLARLSSRCANALTALGAKKGDGLFVLVGRIPELYLGVLGGLKCGLVVSPLYAAFGPEPLHTRMALGAGRFLLTTASLYRRKVAKIRDSLPQLEHVLVVPDVAMDSCDEAVPAGTLDFHALLASSSPAFDAMPMAADDPAFLHFTSGTSGTPKGALHVHGAMFSHYASSLYALDMHPQDVYWCTADPGWVTGVAYGIVAPLLHGVTSVIDEAEFDAARWYRILDEQAVSVWYTAPTALRMMMKAGPALARARRYPALRLVASVGEPLNAEVVWWGKEVLGLPIHDNWWQTETGAIMIANAPAMDIKPGSMGKPLPGVEACIVRRGAGGAIRVIDDAGSVGELALRAGWPSMFRGYLGEEARYRQCFAEGLYLSGDLVRRDAEGYYWFVGRLDDVIKSAGHLIGPFEVESVLMEHAAVAEAGVIGKPDDVLGERVKAFVALKAGYDASEALRRDLLAHARRRLGAAVAPREIDFAGTLPRTRSGKILRRLLKARELGLPEGDLSTLEESALKESTLEEV